MGIKIRKGIAILLDAVFFYWIFVRDTAYLENQSQSAQGEGAIIGAILAKILIYLLFCYIVDLVLVKPATKAKIKRVKASIPKSNKIGLAAADSWGVTFSIAVVLIAVVGYLIFTVAEAPILISKENLFWFIPLTGYVLVTMFGLIMKMTYRLKGYNILLLLVLAAISIGWVYLVHETTIHQHRKGNVWIKVCEDSKCTIKEAYVDGFVLKEVRKEPLTSENLSENLYVSNRTKVGIWFTDCKLNIFGFADCYADSPDIGHYKFRGFYDPFVHAKHYQNSNFLKL